MRVRGNRLRWLFWLHWKLFTRRQPRQITGLILSLIVILPLSSIIAIGTHFAYRSLPAPANAEVPMFVLSGFFFL